MLLASDFTVLTTVLTGLGAILSSAAGVMLVVREMRSRQHNEIERLDAALGKTWEEVVSYHAYAAKLRLMLADHGVDPPPLPATQALNPHPEAWNESV